MATIAIVSQKGGSGKTTLALHLATSAAYNDLHTCVIDTDPQATAAAWGDWRGGDYQPQVVTSPPSRLAQTIQKAAKIGVELIVVDTPPHGESASREAVKAADLVLIPTRPRAFDLHALEATAELIGYAKKPAFVLLNAVPARATRQIAEASTVIEGLGLKVCPISFGDRAAFYRSSATGEVAAEADPEGKAASEANALWRWVCQQVALPGST